VASVAGNTRFAGTTVSSLTPAVAQEMGLPFDAKGVVVTDVKPNSPAQQMGLLDGDIVVSLNGTDIGDVDTFKRIASARSRGWQIVIQRQGQLIRSYLDG
jgi:S1-C subfamily serine protease